jgi:hypothetical protein
VDPAILEVGRSLIDAEDKKVSHHVRQKLATARIVLEALTEEERLARTAVLRDVEETVDCPVCGTPLPPRVRFVRMTEERLGGDGLVHDLIYVIDGIDCPVCTVRLDGTAEVHAAGLPQLVTLTSETSFAERYMQDAADWEYGND